METVTQEGLGVKAIVQVNETAVREELKEMVRQSVEETLNGLLDAKADRLCQAGRYVTHHTQLIFLPALLFPETSRVLLYLPFFIQKRRISHALPKMAGQDRS